MVGEEKGQKGAANKGAEENHPPHPERGKRGEEKPPVKRALTQGKIILNLTKSDAEMRPCTDIPDEAPSTHIVEGGEPFEGEDCRASLKKNLGSEKKWLILRF